MTVYIVFSKPHTPLPWEYDYEIVGVFRDKEVAEKVAKATADKLNRGYDGHSEYYTSIEEEVLR